MTVSVSPAQLEWAVANVPVKILNGDGPASVAYSPEAPLTLVTALQLANFNNERLGIEGDGRDV